MGNWGISPNAPEKEKIKADFNGALMGFNSCGIIDYETYSELYDIGMDLFEKMYEQGKKDLNQAKKPHMEAWGVCPDGNDIWECYCPECNFEFDEYEFKYCPKCGQKIDWSKDNE